MLDKQENLTQITGESVDFPLSDSYQAPSMAFFLWPLNEVRYYAPIAGGCFMCLYDKPGHAICKFSCNKKECRIAVERLATIYKDE